jgi:hypothetical protein
MYRSLQMAAAGLIMLMPFAVSVTVPLIIPITTCDRCLKNTGGQRCDNQYKEQDSL